MRYLGGGIGHRGTSTYAEKANSEDQDDEPEEDTDIDKQANSALSKDLGGIAEETEEAADDNAVEGQTVYEDGEEDYGYESSEHGEEDNEGEREGGDDDDELELLDGLGAEDGEDVAGMDEDLEDSEGFAPL